MIKEGKKKNLPCYLTLTAYQQKLGLAPVPAGANITEGLTNSCLVHYFCGAVRGLYGIGLHSLLSVEPHVASTRRRAELFLPYSVNRMPLPAVSEEPGTPGIPYHPCCCFGSPRAGYKGPPINRVWLRLRHFQVGNVGGPRERGSPGEKGKILVDDRKTSQKQEAQNVYE